jgi:Gaa1-like, GPI transamidase component
VCIDLPLEHRFKKISISYDGINGQLPNLNLVNTAVSVASGQTEIRVPRRVCKGCEGESRTEKSEYRVPRTSKTASADCVSLDVCLMHQLVSVTWSRGGAGYSFCPGGDV